MKYAKLFIIFVYHQAMSCIFPVSIFLTLAISKLVQISYLPRYDFILISCLVIQWLMLKSGLESRDELKVIAVFHLIGLALELYKVNIGSWSYPEEAHTKIFGVPLYSGFMYASVASYMCQSWRRLNLRLIYWPNRMLVWSLGGLIYLNFYTNFILPDIRWFLIIFMFILFYRTRVLYTLMNKVFYMPIVLSFLFIGFFIWIAENISTFLGAWQYPNQSNYWQLVHFSKITSWFLLVVISFLIVSELKYVKRQLKS
ncbi:DUF817 domain-containing protein [Chengkuizengella axinellae]|uniref:DUF817 domain-containing protein n=1 Tax=Chengkuizengella axinellae TaxID=3064388 RepID=A0ABT9J3N7_9BACL|nr:DUF817 domain-containing protein [Chengkuizengella sp. 2205SS18-9]MDP5276219.1 DUF817 domain-containing protein [Chengkuizengella sp. 2205SS18-9]